MFFVVAGFLPFLFVKPILNVYLGVISVIKCHSSARNLFEVVFLWFKKLQGVVRVLSNYEYHYFTWWPSFLNIWPSFNFNFLDVNSRAITVYTCNTSSLCGCWSEKEKNTRPCWRNHYLPVEQILIIPLRVLWTWRKKALLLSKIDLNKNIEINNVYL